MQIIVEREKGIFFGYHIHFFLCVCARLDIPQFGDIFPSRYFLRTVTLATRQLLHDMGLAGLTGKQIIALKRHNFGNKGSSKLYIRTFISYLIQYSKDNILVM